jgi:hypothetical protein
MIPEITAVKEIIKANSTAVYQDAAQPSIRVVGKALAQCASLFATPAGRMAEIFEKNIHRYIDKLEGLKEEDIVSPDTRILVPVLEKMRFIDEEEVANYYAEILATASKREHASKVMITFIEILNRLTADEIRILEYINSPENTIITPEFTDEELEQYGLPREIRGVKEIHLGGSLPVIDVKIVTEGKKGYSTHLENFCCLEVKLKLKASENVPSYFNNLISLGLLERKFGTSFAVEKIYDHLEKHSSIESAKSKLEETQKFEFGRGRIELTALARRLLELSSSKYRSEKG